jgi:hypothetical protein
MKHGTEPASAMTATKEKELVSSPTHNTATRAVASTLGILLGTSSVNHGLLETLQGNHPTSGFFVKALGPGHTWTVWTRGSEPAFTLVHNFLLTGVLATIAGLLLIVWSLRFIHRRHGPTIFLLLSVTSFLVGGGLAQFLLFTLNWAVATRISAPLAFWRWCMPSSMRRTLGRLWRWTLAAEVVFFLAALQIATFGYFPELPRDTQVLHRVLIQLGFAIILAFLFSIVCGFAYDVEARSRPAEDYPTL